jgi:hypothetical protein
MKKVIRLLLFVLMAICTACTAPSTATIGKNGGTIAVGKARLEIPPGALDKDTQVSISEVTGSDNLIGPTYDLQSAGLQFAKPAIGPSYDLQPAGLQFAKPAILSIDYSASDLPDGAEPDEVAIVSLDEHYEAAQDDTMAPTLLKTMPHYIKTTISDTGTTAKAEITHFSNYGIEYTVTLTASPNETKWILNPQDNILQQSEYFDYGKEETFITTMYAASGTAHATYALALPLIQLHVETFCNGDLCSGDATATCYIAKIFHVKAGQKTQTISGAVGFSIVDTGGDATGNCNVGERRVRVMDLGTGENIDKDVPVELASASDEWHDLPGIIAPHEKTSPDGKDYAVSVTFSVDHYYAAVVDLMASSGVNSCKSPVACCPSSQDWSGETFKVTGLLLTTGQ